MFSIPWRSPRRQSNVQRPFTPSPSDAPPLASLGIESEHYTDAVRVRSGVTTELADLAKPHLATTWSLAEWKEWIGVADASLDPATVSLDPTMMPERDWSGRRIRSARDLNDAERADVERAANLYVFGYSPWAESYREVIEICHAPFRAAVYPIRSLHIGTDARLNVSGLPAVLVLGDVVLEPRGQFALYTAARVWIDRITRF